MATYAANVAAIAIFNDISGEICFSYTFSAVSHDAEALIPNVLGGVGKVQKKSFKIVS